MGGGSAHTRLSRRRLPVSLFSFSTLFLNGLQKGFLGTFHHSLPSMRVTKNGLISRDTLKKVYVRIVP